MNFFRFVPIKLTLFLVLGIVIEHYANLGTVLSLTLVTLFVTFLAFIFFKQGHRNSISFGVITLSTTICIGILVISLWKPKNQTNHYSNQSFKEQQAWQLKIREVLKSSSFSDRYIGKLHAMDGQPVSGKIMLSFSLDTTGQKLRVDDELLVFGKLSQIKEPLNPHQFDYKRYLERLGLYHQLRLPNQNYVRLENPSQTIIGISASVRTKISLKLQQANFGSDELGIIQALLLGQRNDISEATYNNYKNAGAVHILAVSGLHIGILLLLLQFLFQPLELLPKGKTIKLITIVIVLWCFALLAGFSASVVRAVTMFSFVAYALYLNRPSNTFNILALSMFFILLVINPMLLFQAGFQMSYAAVFAIIWIYPTLQRFWNPKNSALRKIWQLLSVSIAAQLGVLPISLFYFHQFPGLFFISNVLIVPFLGLILGMGILVIVLALLNILPDFLVIAYNFLIKLMNTVIEWVAQQESFIFKNISFDWVQLIVLYLILISIVLVFTEATFKRVRLLIVCIIVFQIWMFYSIYITSQKENLLIAHQSKNSILIHQKGTSLKVLTTHKKPSTRITKDYQIAERIKTIRTTGLQNSYTFKNKTMIIIDSLGIYPLQKVDYVLLTQSPKINLERMLDSIKPTYIIADGSNYSSYVLRWKATCLKRKLPFHYTGEKGAYYFE